MSILQCPSCGAGAEPAGAVSYVVCTYCSCAISLAEFYKESSSITIDALKDYGLTEEENISLAKTLDHAHLYLEANDYIKASQLFSDCLSIFPKHLPSRFNLALCTLYDDELSRFEGAKKAKKLLDVSAKDYELNPELMLIRESISFNIASVGLNIGNSTETIKLLELSKEICGDHPVRDQLIREYFDDIFVRQDKWFKNEIQLKKRDFSINNTLLDLLSSGAPYSQDLANLGATILLFLKDHPSAINSKITGRIKEFENVVLEFCSNEVEIVKIGLFGVKFKSFIVK